VLTNGRREGGSLQEGMDVCSRSQTGKKSERGFPPGKKGKMEIKELEQFQFVWGEN